MKNIIKDVKIILLQDILMQTTLSDTDYDLRSADIFKK